jgi:hypothetical protein
MTADMYTVIDKILFVGGSNDDVAFKWSFQAIMELPLFFLGGWMLLKLGSKKILIFSIIFLYNPICAVCHRSDTVVADCGLGHANADLSIVYDCSESSDR